MQNQTVTLPRKNVELMLDWLDGHYLKRPEFEVIRRLLVEVEEYQAGNRNLRTRHPGGAFPPAKSPPLQNECYAGSVGARVGFAMPARSLGEAAGKCHWREVVCTFRARVVGHCCAVWHRLGRAASSRRAFANLGADTPSRHRAEHNDQAIETANRSMIEPSDAQVVALALPGEDWATGRHRLLDSLIARDPYS